jgi:hypothetical protein
MRFIIILGIAGAFIASVAALLGAAKLPVRVRVGKAKFVFWQTIAALAGLALSLSPSVGLWLFLAPHGFFQRLLTLGCCTVLLIPLSVAGFFLYATISKKTTGF